MFSTYRKLHLKYPVGIHPIPPPNGGGKGRINFYYHTRPYLYFYPTPTARQTSPTARRCLEHQIWQCLHLFTYTRPTRIPPHHSPPFLLSQNASKIPYPIPINIIYIVTQQPNHQNLQNFTLSHLSPEDSWFIPESPVLRSCGCTVNTRNNKTFMSIFFINFLYFPSFIM